MALGPVVEAALPEHAVERNRLEGRAQHQRLVGAQRLHRGHDPREGLPAPADVLAHVEVHAAGFRQIRERARPLAPRTLPGDRRVRRDHADAFRTPFSTASGTPADAAASRSVSCAPQQWLIPISCMTWSAPARRWATSPTV